MAGGASKEPQCVAPTLYTYFFSCAPSRHHPFNQDRVLLAPIHMAKIRSAANLFPFLEAQISPSLHAWTGTPAICRKCRLYTGWKVFCPFLQCPPLTRQPMRPARHLLLRRRPSHADFIPLKRSHGLFAPIYHSVALPTYLILLEISSCTAISVSGIWYLPALVDGQRVLEFLHGSVNKCSTVPDTSLAKPQRVYSYRSHDPSTVLP